MKMSEIEAVSFSRNGFKPHVKSPIIWGHKGGAIYPLCYLTKPRSVSDDEWELFLDGFSFTVKKAVDE